MTTQKITPEQLLRASVKELRAALKEKERRIADMELEELRYQHAIDLAHEAEDAACESNNFKGLTEAHNRVLTASTRWRVAFRLAGGTP